MNCDIVYLLPLFTVTIGAILLMLLSAFESIRIEVASALSVGIFAVAFIVQLVPIGLNDVLPFVSLFNGMLAVNDFTRIASMIIIACGLFTAMSAISYFRQNNFGSLEFFSLMTFAVSGMMLLTMAQELITVFIALETASLSIYALVGYNRRNILSSEAVLKYLILGAFAGGFFTMGIALVYGALGDTGFAAIAARSAETVYCRIPLWQEVCSSFSSLCSSKSPYFPSIPGLSMYMTVHRYRLPVSWQLP